MIAGYSKPGYIQGIQGIQGMCYEKQYRSVVTCDCGVYIMNEGICHETMGRGVTCDCGVYEGHRARAIPRGSSPCVRAVPWMRVGV